MYPCNFYECFTTGSRPLVVFGQTPVTVEPSERPFNNPTLGLHDKANLAHPFFDYHSQPTPANSGMTQGRIQVGVPPDLFQPLDRLPQPLHHSDAAHTVWHRSRHDHQRPQQAEGVNRHKPFAANDFFSPHRLPVGHPVRWFLPIGCRGLPPRAWAFSRPTDELWSARRRGFGPKCRLFARGGSSRRRSDKAASRGVRRARHSRCVSGTG